MKKFLLITLFLSALILKAQKRDSSTTVSADSAKFLPVDVEHQFRGGMPKLFLYFEKNEKDNGNKGVVRISFVVERDGSISNIKVIEGLSDSADKEAIRLISQSPKWIPGMQGSRPVRVKFTMPVYFPAK